MIHQCGAVPKCLRASGPGRQWHMERGTLIDREHSVFLHERAADLQNVRNELGKDTSALAVMIHVMARYRKKYERMSESSRLEPLPTLSTDDAGRCQLVPL